MFLLSWCLTFFSVYLCWFIFLSFFSVFFSSYVYVCDKFHFNFSSESPQQFYFSANETKKQPSVPTLTKTLSLSFGSPEVHNTASSLTPTSELIKWALMFTHSDRCFISHPAGGSTGASSITWCWKCLRRSRLKAWWQWRVKSCAVVVNTWGHMRLVLSSS